MNTVDDEGTPLRMPGLYRGWELPLILGNGVQCRIEEVGRTTHGARLFAVWTSATPVAWETGA
jgi:hypothetical protein